MIAGRGAAPLRVSGLSKSYGDVCALDDVNLEFAAGSLTAVVGPSGCGKSTLLTCIAGLTRLDCGEVELDGAPINLTAAEDRPISLVFQKPLLFPHLSVGDNVGFGLRMQGVPRAKRRVRVESMLAEVRLDGFAGRRVGELSGGQEQRASLARALVLEPRLLLLDEPFSQLDAALRVQMRALVRRLHDASDLTTIFVTHDQAEAVDVADDIALLLDGRLAGHDAPERFFRDPPSLAAARFFGVGNEIAGAVADGHFRAGALDVVTDAADGDAVLVIRPEAVRLVTGPSALDSELEDADRRIGGRLTSARFAGTHVVCEVSTQVGEVSVHVPVGVTIEVGAQVGVELPQQSCTVFGVDPTESSTPATGAG